MGRVCKECRSPEVPCECEPAVDDVWPLRTCVHGVPDDRR